MFIIFESCLSSGASGVQSNFFAKISAWFINNTTEPIIPNSIDPIEIKEVTDSSYLGKDTDGVSKIAIGSTSLISIPVQYPDKSNNYDEYNYQYNLDYITGNKDDYSVTLSSSKNKNIYTIDLRITATDMTSDIYQINVNIAGGLKYEYKFHIVELEEPTEYESKIEKNTLKIGETTTITTKLLGKGKTDWYLRRYFDESKITRSSLDESIATIDEFGVIHGVSAGSTTIKYGKYDFPITVTGESITKPVSNSMTLNIFNGSKTSPSLLDYDYVFEKDENSNNYSSLIYPSFSNTTLEDQSVSFKVSEPLMVRLSPYKYDEDGYPVYMDDDNEPCVRVAGYRKKGDVTIYCYSNNDNSIYQSIDLTVDEAIPTEMTLNVKKDLNIRVNAQQVVSASFNPKNVNNRNIHVEVSNSDIVSISNNNTSSVTLMGVGVGTTHITVSSVANPSLVKEFNISATAKSAIDKEEYSDFHQTIRKSLGHFLLFAITAVFGAIFAHTYFDDYKKAWLLGFISLGIGVFVASLSEFIQYFVKTRSGTLLDIGIDSLGYLIGTITTIGVIYLIMLIKTKISKKKNVNDNIEQ